jgi:hypothetical protein
MVILYEQNAVIHVHAPSFHHIVCCFVKAQLPAFTPNIRFSDSYKACSSLLSEMKGVVVFLADS